MKTSVKRLLSLLLVFVMMLGTVSVDAFAAEPTKQYEVTINVAPSTANVTFYAGNDTTTALTTEVQDNGVMSNYHQYVLTVPEGTYTYRGVDGENNIGGMTFTVPLEEEIMSDGSASGEGQTMTLRRVNYYTSNSAITAIGDYTLHLFPASLPETVNGEQYIDSSNRVVTPVLVMARGNALTYQQLVTLHGEIAETYAVTPTANVTFNAGTSAQNKTFSLSRIVEHTVTAPEAATVQMFQQINNFNVRELTDKTVSEPDNDGMVTHTYKTTGGNELTYRVSMEGKITRAGYLGSSAENVVITFEENENPKTTENKMDSSAMKKRIESSTMVNINNQNNLWIEKNDTFRLRAYRAAWQIINNDTANIMIEPDFHYEIISGGEHISMDIVDDQCTGNATGNWVDITGVSEGTAIVEVTYDAIMIGGNGTSYDGLYGATNPQRTSLFVIQVGEAEEHTLKMSADGRTELWDTEYDTVYSLEDTASLTFTATLGDDAPDKVELSTDKGKTWTSVAAVDGKYTASGLVGGNNILRFTKGAVVEYQVVRAAKVTQTITNLSRPEGVLAGDQLKVVYGGLFTPISKFSGVYNPGFGQKAHKVTYTLPDGYQVTAKGGQYDFIGTNEYVITVPEDAAKGDVTISEGHVNFGVMGNSDVIGGHRALTDAGCGTNMSAVASIHNRGVLPDIAFTVIDMPYTDITVSVNEGATIVMKDSTGTEVQPDENGIYKLPLGIFDYVVELEGYVTERGSFEITLSDANEGTMTVTIPMRKIEGAIWDGSTTTEPKQVDGVYQIGTGAEMAWFATNHNNSNAVLTADISLGGLQWTPVKEYKGTFDGNGYWVTDLYIESTSKNQGLFAKLNAGVIKNLGVNGYVTSTGDCVGGITAALSAKATIENCVSNVIVTGGRYTGGVAGQQAINTTIRNSYNMNSVTGTHKNGNAGGISGGSVTASMAFTIENCYNLGVVTANKNYGGLTYSTKSANSVNSYYLSGTGDGGNATAGTEISAEELKAMAESLGEAWATDTNNVNKGFPILTWQVPATEEAKEAAKAEIDSYVTENIKMSEYRSEQQAELETIISEAKAAVDAAHNMAVLKTVVEEAKTALDEVKTDDELLAEEFVAAKAEVEEAQTAVATATTTAEEKRTEAEAAQVAAEAAKAKAKEAQEAAEEAKKTAEEAQAAYDAAVEAGTMTEEELAALLEDAKATASTYEAAAATAAETASAYEEALEAQETAEAEANKAEINAAKAEAQEAEAVATLAQVEATIAQKNALKAQEAANADKVNAEAAKAAAEAAQAAAEAAQKLAEAEKLAAEEAKKAAQVEKEAAAKEKELAEAAKEAAKLAEEAAKLAKVAAEEAQKAAELAKEAAEADKMEANKALEEALKAKEAAIIASIGEADITLKNASNTSIKVTWDKLPGADGYMIYRAVKGGEFELIKTIENKKTTSFTDKKLTCGKTYVYKIQGFKNVDDEVVYGEMSDETSLKAKPVATKITSLKKGKKKVTIKWKKVSGASGYVIYRATKKNGTYKKVKTIKKAGTVKWTNKKLKSKKTYYYKVRAYKTVNGKKVYSSYSTVKSVKTK